MGCMQSKPALVSGESSNTRGQEQKICAENSPHGVSLEDATDLFMLEAAIEAENRLLVGAAAQKMSDSRINVVDHSRNELPVYVPFSVPPYATYSPGGMSSAIRDGGGGSGGGCDSGGGGAVGGCGGGGGGGGCGG
jgi:hypothetical protein